MPPNIKKTKFATDEDQIMIDDPIDNPEWWKDHAHIPGTGRDTRRAAAAEHAGIPSAVSAWATVNPDQLGEQGPYAVSNIVNGQWCANTASRMSIPNPMDKDKPDIFTIPDTQTNELEPFIQSLRAVPKSGVHNPLKNNDRYVKFGDISRKVTSG